MDEKKKIILEVDNISKRFNNTYIIDKLSFKINKGEIVKIDGPNGSGKTTLLKIRSIKSVISIPKCILYIVCLCFIL